MPRIVLQMLEDRCRLSGVDTHEIDSHLTYDENLALLEERFGQLEQASMYKKSQQEAY